MDKEVCGDGELDPNEDCDDAGESADCDDDCTVVACGDGIVNATAGEICEPTSGEPYDRCAFCDYYGAGLDGTWGSKWEPMAPSPVTYIYALQSFHYSGEPAFYDSYANLRYDIAKDSWTYVEGDNPVSNSWWRNGAVDATTLWIPAWGVMHKFDFASETWTSLTGDIPAGSAEFSAAVFDGEGNIWYHGPDGLVRYDPATDTASAEIEHESVEVYQTRFAYDPIGHKIAFAGHLAAHVLVYDIAKGTFALSSTSPGGSIRDNSCGDNSGGLYVGSGSNRSMMYRYDIANDTFTELPLLPTEHDDNSTCIVSQDGYLYVGTGKAPAFYRLALGKYPSK